MYAVGKAEGPFELQLWHLFNGYSCRSRALKSRIGDVSAPAIPCSLRRLELKGNIARAMVRHRLSVASLRAPQWSASQVNRYQTLLGIRQVFSLLLHQSGSQR